MPRRMPENTLRSREEFFARERAAWDDFIQSWSDLPDSALAEPGASGAEWSVKDVLNHIAAWQEAAARCIGDLLAGRWARLGMNTEAFNAAQFARDRERPLGESRARLMEARDRLLELLAPLTDEQLLDEYGRQQIGWWAKWNTYAHYEPHTAAIREFRLILGS